MADKSYGFCLSVQSFQSLCMSGIIRLPISHSCVYCVRTLYTNPPRMSCIRSFDIYASAPTRVHRKNTHNRSALYVALLIHIEPYRNESTPHRDCILTYRDIRSFRRRLHQRNHHQRFAQPCVSRQYQYYDPSEYSAFFTHHVLLSSTIAPHV
jgi:hypothetical protein